MKFEDFYKVAVKTGTVFVLNRKEGENTLDALVNPAPLTPYGERIFKNILEAEVAVETPPPNSPDSIIVKILGEGEIIELCNYFALSTEGQKLPDITRKLFANFDRHPPTREVARELFKSLLYIGVYKYAVQLDGVSNRILYAWNDEEAMEMAGFPPESRIM